jgi:hypothetical protein
MTLALGGRSVGSGTVFKRTVVRHRPQHIQLVPAVARGERSDRDEALQPSLPLRSNDVAPLRLVKLESAAMTGRIW